MSLTLYGIKNCDTIRKARAWLDAHGLGHDFHDYKRAGIDAATLETWADELGWEALLNRSGTTFRALPDADKAGLDKDRAIRLMVANPSMIKRPVLDTGKARVLGFNADRYEALLGGHSQPKNL